MPVRVRPAQAADRPFVLGLVPELHAFGPPPWRDPRVMHEVDEGVIGAALDGDFDDAIVLVAELDGVPVGFIHLCEEDDYYTGPCAHVGDVVVTERARGRGVGRALLAAGESWARERGYDLLSLNVFLGNARARALYEELGFNPETVRHVKVLG